MLLNTFYLPPQRHKQPDMFCNANRKEKQQHDLLSSCLQLPVVRRATLHHRRHGGRVPNTISIVADSNVEGHYYRNYADMQFPSLNLSTERPTTTSHDVDPYDGYCEQYNDNKTNLRIPLDVADWAVPDSSLGMCNMPLIQLDPQGDPHPTGGEETESVSHMGLKGDHSNRNWEHQLSSRSRLKEERAEIIRDNCVEDPEEHHSESVRVEENSDENKADREDNVESVFIESMREANRKCDGYIQDVCEEHCFEGMRGGLYHSNDAESVMHPGVKEGTIEKSTCGKLWKINMEGLPIGCCTAVQIESKDENTDKRETTKPRKKNKSINAPPYIASYDHTHARLMDVPSHKHRFIAINRMKVDEIRKSRMDNARQKCELSLLQRLSYAGRHRQLNAAILYPGMLESGDGPNQPQELTHLPILPRLERRGDESCKNMETKGKNTSKTYTVISSHGVKGLCEVIRRSYDDIDAHLSDGTYKQANYELEIDKDMLKESSLPSPKSKVNEGGHSVKRNDEEVHQLGTSQDAEQNLDEDTLIGNITPGLIHLSEDKAELEQRNVQNMLNPNGAGVHFNYDNHCGHDYNTALQCPTETNGAKHSIGNNTTPTIRTVVSQDRYQNADDYSRCSISSRQFPERDAETLVGRKDDPQRDMNWFQVRGSKVPFVHRRRKQHLQKLTEGGSCATGERGQDTDGGALTKSQPIRLGRTKVRRGGGGGGADVFVKYDHRKPFNRSQNAAVTPCPLIDEWFSSTKDMLIQGK